MNQLGSSPLAPPVSLRALAEAPSEVLDAIPAAVYVVDSDGHLIRFNRRAVEVWGRIPRTGADGDRYCGSLKAYSLDGQPLPLSQAPMAEVLRTGRPAKDREVEIERPDGGRSVLMVNIEPLHDASGRMVGAINCFQDITERVKAEQALQRSQQDLEDLFENGAVGMHLVGADGTIIRANQAELDLLGYEAEEYIGRSIRDFHVDEDTICDILARLSSGERLQNYPARLRARDGSIRHVLITSNVRFSDGEFVNTRCFTVDVSNWRASEAAKRQTEQRLAVTYACAPIGIGETDRDGRFLEANDALCRITGYARSELLGMSFVELTAPDDREPDLAQYRRQVQDGLPAYSVEKRYVRKDGQEVFVQVLSSAVRDEAGRFQHGVRIVQDITERRLTQDRLAESERRARELLQALPVAIYTTDRDGRISFYNDAAVEFAGREPVLGEDSWCVTWRLFDMDGTPLPHDRCPMAATLLEGVEVRGAMAVAERPDGARVPFMPFPKLLRNSDGEVVGAINMLVDMTERQRAEDQQRTLIDELNHRVKNTLATVQSIASQTLRSTPDAFVENFEARLVALSAAHNLLTRKRWMGVDLGELLEQELAPHMDEDDQRLSFEGCEVALSPRTGLVLGMLVHELATNAVKYGALSARNGRVLIRWSVARADTCAPRLRFEWVESGGPKVAPPQRRGFGTRLIERSITRDLGGAVDLRFAPGGLECVLDFALDR